MPRTVSHTSPNCSRGYKCFSRFTALYTLTNFLHEHLLNFSKEPYCYSQGPTAPNKPNLLAQRPELLTTSTVLLTRPLLLTSSINCSSQGSQLLITSPNCSSQSPNPNCYWQGPSAHNKTQLLFTGPLLLVKSPNCSWQGPNCSSQTQAATHRAPTAHH